MKFRLDLNCVRDPFAGTQAPEIDRFLTSLAEEAGVAEPHAQQLTPRHWAIHDGLGNRVGELRLE